MNRKMIGSANGAKTARTGATPSSTASVGPSSAVTGSGSASVIQSTIMQREDRRQSVRGRRQARHRPEQQREEDQRRDDQSDRAAAAIELLFGR